MVITQMPVDRLIPYARNPRCNAAAIDAVKASIAEFGFRQPIVVDEQMVVIVGHTRLAAAKALGLATVPVHIAEGLTPAQTRAYRLMDNRSHENADWDDDLLKLEFADLQLDGFDLELTGFDADQLSKLLGAEASDALTDPDDVPDAPDQPCTRPGDLWRLGIHRVLCGNATIAEDVARVMAGALADMAFTDPPYNVDYGKPAKGKSNDRRILNDALGDDFCSFLQAACTHLLAVTKGACYVCMSSSELHTLQRAWLAAGGKWSTYLIWAKNTFTLGRSDYQRQYEPILYGWKAGAEHYWCGARDQGDVWFCDKPRANDLHPTMKPVELVERAIRNSSKTRDLVLDPFGGSGTTLIACEQSGRAARLLELDPKYVDVIVERWQRLTGDVAVHDGEESSFAELKAERASARQAKETA